MERNGGEEATEPNSEPGANSSSKLASNSLNLGEKGEGDGSDTREHRVDQSVALPTITVVITQPDEVPNSKNLDTESVKKICLSRDESYREQCRVCQQQSDEPLVELGCSCRGDLSKAHRSCIDVWFRTRGSNNCEICQQVAANIPAPPVQPFRSNTNYWVWRVDSTYGGGQQVRERSCKNPLWIAFAILIGGLLLDVLISISLGVSALPVNIIIGVLIVLGLGTAIRLGLECCHELGSQRTVHRLDMNISSV